MFTDLGFNFTAVDGGKKCTDTKDLALTIEVLSNEMVTTGEEVSSDLSCFELFCVLSTLTNLVTSICNLDGYHFKATGYWRSPSNLG